jgi:hypothetical protein
MGLLRCDIGRAPNGANLYTLLDGAEVSATLRTVRNDAGPQGCVVGVRNIAAKVSATLRTKQTNKQTIEHIPSRKRSDARVSGRNSAEHKFVVFWRIYPHRGGHSDPRKPAYDKFVAKIENGVDPDLMIEGARRYADFVARSGTAGRFVKQAVAWLNQECWQQYADQADDPEPLRAGMI